MKRVMVVVEKNFCNTMNYVDALVAAGAEPFPVVADSAEEVVREVSRADGVLIPGGCDINPHLYREENTASEAINDALDVAEKAAILEACRQKKALLGICRGMQLINVVLGGSLVQNVSDCEVHRQKDGEDRAHETRVEKPSFLFDIYGAEKIRVNSAHHQAVKTLGDGLRAVQFCADGCIEAIQHESLPIIAVQWHPERMCLSHARTDTEDGLKVFDYFVHHLLRA